MTCRNRHCAKCQTNARDKWLAAREKELLPVRYVHVVFTLPHQLSRLALSNKEVVYNLLFRASAAALLKIAADPKHLGADIGFMSVLHSWGQTVRQNPHSKCLALSSDSFLMNNSGDFPCDPLVKRACLFDEAAR
jgi:hypothetical protein